jgi:hypothetical protein
VNYKGKVKTGRKTRGQSNRTFTSNREQIVSQLYKDLDEWEKKMAPEKIAELIAAHCDKYHGNNPKLIAMQDPYATDVDAHGAWRERGRTNIGSNNGIKIVIPNFHDTCKVCKERENHPNHVGHHRAAAMNQAKIPATSSAHLFDPVVDFFYTTVYDIRFTIPDTAAAKNAWKADHPEDLEGKRYWDDADDYKDYEKYGAIL